MELERDSERRQENQGTMTKGRGEKACYGAEGEGCWVIKFIVPGERL
jgi:hypothetical protein